MLCHNFQIALFTETWLTMRSEDLLLTLGTNYKVFRKDRSNRIGGGVLVLFDKSLHVTLIDSNTHEDIDYICFDIYLDRKQHRIILIYKPPHANNDHLSSIISQFSGETMPLTVIGDFNIPNLAEVDSFFNFCSGLSLNQLVNTPTRKDNILDLIFTDTPDLIKDLNVTPPLINCDHNGLSFKISNTLPTNITDNGPKLIRNFKKGDYISLNLYFQNFNWKTELFGNDINLVYQKFLEILNFGIESFIPLTPLNKSGNYHLPPHIKKLSRYRDKLFRNIQHPSVSIKFEKATIDLNKQILKFRKNYEKRLLGNSPKSLYEFVKSTIHPKGKSSIQSLIGHNGEIIEDPHKLGKLFQEQFLKNFQQAPKVTVSSENETTDPLFEHSLIFTTNVKIFDILDKLSPKLSTSAPDRIPQILLKKCSHSLTEPIARILRLSFLHNQVPDIWKLAHITPIPKTPKARLVDEFRPISNTCIISKIAESLLKTEIEGFTNHIEIIPDSQHGFRNKHSVITALTETYDDFTRAIDDKKNVDCVYLDIKSAFDTVDHNLLLSKLSKMGLGPNCVDWLSSFLKNRKISVKIGDNVTESTYIGSGKGVPQGAVLSPLLFNLFIADLKDIIPDNVIVKQYADDIKVYVMYPKNNVNAKKDLQNFLNFFDNWCIENGLKLSVLKTKAMYLGSNNTKHTYTLQDNIIPEIQDKIRDLGLHFEPTLKWNKHANLICRNAYFRWFNFYKFFKSTDPKILTRLYTTYVRPTLEFGTVIFNNQSHKLSNSLESVQRKITRMIFKRCLSKSHEFPPSYPDRCKTLKLDTLYFRRKITDLTFLHSVHCNPSSLAPRNRPSLQNTGRTLRFKGIFARIHVRTTLRQNSFCIRAPRQYNNLPESLTRIIDNKIFRKELTKFLSSNRYDLQEPSDL